MNIWFTSDPHYGHKNVIEYCNRPFDNVEQMNEALINNYNACVKPGDLVYFLGDIFFCSSEVARNIMKRLNGKKVLILGNHDQKTNTMYTLGFDAVLTNAQIKVGQTAINLSHYPHQRNTWQHYWYALTNKKYRKKLHFRKMADDGNWLLHGHSHSKKQVNGKMIHIGVDAWDYKPVHIHTISTIINQYNEANK